jgi:hypothetical protein
MGAPKKEPLDDGEWLKGVIRHLGTLGIEVSKDALVVPPKKGPPLNLRKRVESNPITSPREPKKVSQEAPPPVATNLGNPRVGKEEPVKDIDDLTRNPDGTFSVPARWRLGNLNQELRRKVVSASNRLRWTAEELEKKDRKKFAPLVTAHRKLVAELLSYLR